MRKLRLALLLTMASAVFLPGVAGAQTTTEPPKQCPPPTIYSSWADYDDVYTVKLANHLSVLGLSCQHAQAGLIMVALPERTVLASTVVSLYGIMPGGVGLGPPAEVAMPRPVFPCGTHPVEIEVVPASLAAGLVLGQQVAGGRDLWAQKLETVDNGICPPVVTAAASLPTPSTVAPATSSPAVALSVTAEPMVRAPSAAAVDTTRAAPASPATTSTPPVTEGTTVEAVNVTTTTSQATRVLGISAVAPAATPIAAVSDSGSPPPSGVNHGRLLAGLFAIVAGIGALLIGWRRRLQ